MVNPFKNSSDLSPLPTFLRDQVEKAANKSGSVGLYVNGSQFEVLTQEEARSSGASLVSISELNKIALVFGKDTTEIQNALAIRNIILREDSDSAIGSIFQTALDIAARDDAFSAWADIPVMLPDIPEVHSLHHSLSETSRLSNGDTRLIRNMEKAYSKLSPTDQSHQATARQFMLNHYALATDPSHQPYAVIADPNRRVSPTAGAYILQPNSGKDGAYTLYVRQKAKGAQPGSIKIYHVTVLQRSGEIQLTDRSTGGVTSYKNWKEVLTKTSASTATPPPSRPVRHLHAHITANPSVISHRKDHEILLVEMLGARMLRYTVNGRNQRSLIKAEGDQLVVTINGKKYKAATLHHLIELIRKPAQLAPNAKLAYPPPKGIDDYFHQSILHQLIDSNEHVRVIPSDPANPILNRSWVVTPEGPVASFYNDNLTGYGKLHFIAHGSLKDVTDVKSRIGPMVASTAHITKRGHGLTLGQVDVLRDLIIECGDSPYIATGILAEQTQFHVTVLKPLSDADASAVAFGDAPRDERYQAIYDSAQGLATLHAHDFVWRDAKPDNILLFQDSPAQIDDWDLTLKAGEPTVAMDGTPRYMPPENMSETEAAKSSDVFSFGLTMWELYVSNVELEGSPLDVSAEENIWQFAQRRELLTYDTLEKNGFPTADEAKKDPMLQLIRDMCNPQSPESRPGMDEVVARLSKMPPRVRGVKRPPLPPKNRQ